MKKLMSVLLCVLIMASMVPIFALPVSAAESSDDLDVFPESYGKFDMPIYEVTQSWRYATTFSNVLTNTNNSFASNFYEQMKSDQGFMLTIEAWEIAHLATEPSHSLTSGRISKTNIYKCILFDLLSPSPNAKGYSLEREKYITEVAKIITGDNSPDVNALASQNLTTDSAKKLAKAANIANMAAAIDVGFKLHDIANNMKEAVEAYATYQTIANMKNGTRELLIAIANLPSGALGSGFDSSDLYELRAAASECISYFDEAYDNTLMRVANGTHPFTTAVFNSVASVVFDEAWGIIVSFIPGGSASLLLAKGIRALTNSILDLDERNRLYYQLSGLVAFENAIRHISTNAGNRFLGNPTLQNATFFTQSINMFENTILLGCDYSIEFLQNEADARDGCFNWLPGSYEEFNAMINDIYDIKSSRSTTFESIKANIRIEHNRFCDKFLVERYEVNSDGSTATLTSYIGLNETFNIPSSVGGYTVTKIGKNCFATSSQLKEIIIPNSVWYIAAGAFSNTAISSLVIPDSVTSIDWSAIYGCDNLTTLHIGGGIKTIESNACNGYAHLQKVTIGSGVQHISSNAFANCSSLSSLSLPKTLKSIAAEAFSNTAISSLVIPDSVTSIDWSAIYGCDNLTTLHIGGGIKTIADEAFYQNDLLQTVTIGEGVQHIGKFAFHWCDNLVNVTFPTTLKTIGEGAFYECEKLKNISLHEGLIDIGGAAFAFCNLTGEVKIPDTTVNIDDHAFYGCNIESIKIGKGVTFIGDSAFFGNPLKSLVIPPNVKTVERHAFYDTDIESVVIPNTVETWGDHIFYRCSKLKNVVFSEGVAEIPEGMFFCCTALEHVEIPESVKVIGPMAFYGCSSLEHIDLPSGLNALHGIFTDCTSLKSITIPKGVNDIGFDTFRGCVSLSDVTINSKDYYIGPTAFQGCSSLESIDLSNAKEIYYEAFSDCTSLTDIILPKTSLQISHYDTDDLSPFHNTAYYNNADNWENGVLYIGNHLIDTKNNISGSYLIKDGTVDIAAGAFNDCVNLKSVTVPTSVERINCYAFDGCTSLKNVYYEGSQTEWKAIVDTPNEALTDEIVQWDHECVGEWIIDIPETCTTDGLKHRVCDLCGKNTVAEITAHGHIEKIIPEISPTCVDIGYTEWIKCSVCDETLVPVDILSATGVHTYGDWVISDDMAVKTKTCITCGHKITETNILSKGNWNADGSITWTLYKHGVLTVSGSGEMQAYAAGANPVIELRKQIKTIVIGDGITYISNRAFKGMTGTTSVIFGKDIKSIGYEAFMSCLNLTTVELNEGLTSIGSLAFYGTDIDNVELPSTLETINNRAFKNCEKLTYIAIPDSVTYIGYEVFMGCTSLTGFKWSANVSYINSMMFNGCTSLKEVTIPSTVWSIRSNAFTNSGLEVITFENGNYLLDNPFASTTFTGIEKDSLTFRTQRGTKAHFYAVGKGYNVELI